MLIDFENACLEPKEYDLQRRLWDFAVKNDGGDMYNYYSELIDRYQEHLFIDFELLHDLFIVDFCKTLCWLYGVCEDNTRLDIKRQREDLNDFIFALRKGMIDEMINYIII